MSVLFSLSSFNTSSVLIQPCRIYPPFPYFCRFNTASVLIQLITPIFSKKFSSVSIQLLFLFNLTSVNISNWNIAFQYSFCSYSTPTQISKRFSYARFNTASVLIQQDGELETGKDLLFQYSFCSYSTSQSTREQKKRE